MVGSSSGDVKKYMWDVILESVLSFGQGEIGGNEEDLWGVRKCRGLSVKYEIDC